MAIVSVEELTGGDVTLRGGYLMFTASVDMVRRGEGEGRVLLALTTGAGTLDSRLRTVGGGLRLRAVLSEADT